MRFADITTMVTSKTAKITSMAAVVAIAVGTLAACSTETAEDPSAPIEVVTPMPASTPSAPETVGESQPTESLSPEQVEEEEAATAVSVDEYFPPLDAEGPPVSMIGQITDSQIDRIQEAYDVVTPLLSDGPLDEETIMPALEEANMKAVAINNEEIPEDIPSDTLIVVFLDGIFNKITMNSPIK